MPHARVITSLPPRPRPYPVSYNSSSGWTTMSNGDRLPPDVFWQHLDAGLISLEPEEVTRAKAQARARRFAGLL